ncbi:MAG: pyridoxal phosphate-dependent aminotransferase, partial [Candidatus Thorarchaeota archaeon]
DVFNLQYSPEQVIIGPGSKPLMFAALTALDGPILLTAPSWVSYQHMGRFLSRDVHHIMTDSSNSYRLDPELLANAVQDLSLGQNEQKVLVLNYPCNPTGHSYTENQLKGIAKVARENNIAILSDEIYALTRFTDQEHHSISEYYPEGTLITSGLSKDRSLGGYRLGTLLIPQDEKSLLRSILAVGSEIWSSVSAPIQYAGIEAYRTDTGIIEYINNCTMVHELVTRYVYRRISKVGISCPYPQGAFYLFPDWNDYRTELANRGIATSGELARVLLETYHVATLPGAEFGMPPENLSLRLATVDYEGEQALESFLSDEDSALENPDRFVAEIAPRIENACSKLQEFTMHFCV